MRKRLISLTLLLIMSLSSVLSPAWGILENKRERADLIPSQPESQSFKQGDHFIKAKNEASMGNQRPQLKKEKPFQIEVMKSSDYQRFIDWAAQISGLSKNNPIHLLLYLESAITGKEEVKKTYELLGEILRAVNSQVSDSLSAKEKLKAVYKILTEDFGFRYNPEPNSRFSRNLKSKYLDCDLFSLTLWTIGREREWPIYLVRAPMHLLIRWDEGKDPINFETNNGKFRPDDYYINWLMIDESSIEKDVYLKNLSDKEIYGFFYFNRANIYAEKGYNYLAIKDYDLSLQLYPNNAATYLNRGFTNESIGRLDQAKRDFKKAVELDPNKVEWLSKEWREKIKQD